MPVLNEFKVLLDKEDYTSSDIERITVLIVEVIEDDSIEMKVRQKFAKIYRPMFGNWNNTIKKHSAIKKALKAIILDLDQE